MDTTNINGNVKKINDIRFSDVWVGSSAEAQTESLDGLMTDLNQCVEDIAYFGEILVLRDQYNEIIDEISRLDGLISSCSAVHEDEDCSCRCGEYAAQIIILEAQRKALRDQIISMLSTFVGIDPEVAEAADLTTYDNEGFFADLFNGVFPLYDQNDYADTPYYAPGKTVASSGCALTCAAMVISAYTGQTVTPDMLTQYYDTNLQTTMNHALAAYGIKSANNNALTEEKGSSIGLYSSDVYIDNGFTELGTDTIYFDQMLEKLEEGYVFAAYMKPESDFTDGGHYVLITGINEDGTLNINDPNGNNYNNAKLQDGFENGFDPNYIKAGWGGGYLIEPYSDFKARESNKNEE